MTPSDVTGIIYDLRDPVLLVERNAQLLPPIWVRQDYFNGPHSNWWVSRSAQSSRRRRRILSKLRGRSLK
jgi:hypothetical protein